MIPVNRLSEPTWFDVKVRQKGTLFLEKVPNPTDSQWDSHAFWRETLPEFRRGYAQICNFAATWIPRTTGSDSIDHFIPKTDAPTIAYEWTNFRYASLRFNRTKRKNKILDPFDIDFGWFCIDFSTLFIYPNETSGFPETIKMAIEDTIKILRLNIDDDLVSERIHYYQNYQNGTITLNYLQEKTPFIAYEIVRQGLV